MTATKCGARAGVIGFGIAVLLAVLAFYETSAPSRDHTVGDWVFVGLCPPSIIAMGLDNAGVVGGVIWWFWIALMNAGLYAAVGWSIGLVASRLGGPRA
jgi:hypothetical protein